ncbi:hypothetical protein Pcinc_027941 [Petrolisthes cinctipes]|uniref:Secreted protein n=1 Tax=Petrolisthes cinctipes TaxID=88211 RepID=A0AAE1K9L7_PETCI|nr:hypothetical protein Pcinc_027941 [Petrolisthes cinctipes]
MGESGICVGVVAACVSVALQFAFDGTVASLGVGGRGRDPSGDDGDGGGGSSVCVCVYSNGFMVSAFRADNTGTLRSALEEVVVEVDVFIGTLRSALLEVVVEVFILATDDLQLNNNLDKEEEEPTPADLET